MILYYFGLKSSIGKQKTRMLGVAQHPLACVSDQNTGFIASFRD